jgi:circadian clock protein KaiB
MTRSPRFKFRLYVAGETQNSTRASANLAAFCTAHLPERYEIEVVDVLRDGNRAMVDSVFMTPTLIKVSPSPEKRMIGTLSETKLLLETLGLEA